MSDPTDELEFLPDLHCFPRDDPEFEALSRAALAFALRLSHPDVTILEGLLRYRFPRARVSIRDPLAALDIDRPVWYCFRDGSGLTPSEDDETNAGQDLAVAERPVHSPD